LICWYIYLLIDILIVWYIYCWIYSFVHVLICACIDWFIDLCMYWLIINLFINWISYLCIDLLIDLFVHPCMPLFIYLINWGSSPRLGPNLLSSGFSFFRRFLVIKFEEMVNGRAPKLYSPYGAYANRCCASRHFDWSHGLTTILDLGKPGSNLRCILVISWDALDVVTWQRTWQRA